MAATVNPEFACRFIEKFAPDEVPLN